MELTYDVVVIGSGIGGLTAALTCARAGREVLLLEAGKQFGGYTNPFRRKRYHFDPGIHYIGEAGPGQRFRALLDKLGLEDVRFCELDPDGFDLYSFPGYQVRNCRGLDRFRDRLASDFPREVAGIDRFFELVRDVDRIVTSLARMPRAREVLELLRRAPTLLRFGRATLAEVLDHCFREPLLKAAVSGPIGDVGLPPSRVAAMVHLGVLAHYSTGAYFPQGGSGTLRDAFVRELTRHGVTLKRNARVSNILHDGQRVTGVRTAKGEEYGARAVISNAQATATYEMLGLEVVGRRLQKKLRQVEHSVGSICIFAGVEGSLDTSHIGSANVWHYESADIDASYRSMLESTDARGGSFFLNVPSNKDPESALAPKGKQVVELVTMATRAPFERWFGGRTMKRGADYEKLKEELADHYLGLAETYLPGLRDNISLLEVATPATNHSYTLAPDGNIYGPAHTPEQMGPYRFTSRGAVPGLLLCGASVISAGIVPCASSGRMAGKMALAQLDEEPRGLRLPVAGLLRRALG